MEIHYPNKIETTPAHVEAVKNIKNVV
jgi:hypothetical protein